MTPPRTRTSGPGSLWIGGRVPTTFIVNEPEPTRVELVIWLDATRDKILSGTVVAPTDPPSVLADELRNAIRSPLGAAPARVRVAGDREADLVRGIMPDVTIEVGPTPELERIAHMMSQQLEGGTPPSYLQGNHVTAEAMARYFEHMAALWKAAPWRFFDDSQVLALDVPALGVTEACVSVLGAARQSYGAVVFDSFEDFEQFYSVAGEPPEEDGEVWELGVSSLGFSFERGASLPDSMRREVSDHGWLVATAEAYPLLMPVDPDAHLRPATERDTKLGCATAAAFAALVRTHGRDLRAGRLEDVRETVTVNVPEPVEATIRFPHPQAPDDEADAAPPSPADVERARGQGERRLEAFLASAAVEKRPQAWREVATFMLGSLHDFKLDHVDGRLTGLRSWHLAAFLLDFVPRSVGADAGTVERTPEVLDVYLGWLGANGHEPESTMARARARVTRLREAFEKKALDPACFGPGKAFAMSAQAAGVDFGMREEVDAYQKQHNERHSRENLSGLPALGGPLHLEQVIVSKKLRKPRRWFPIEGEVAPDATAPCPCGSGKRYRRCCMER